MIYRNALGQEVVFDNRVLYLEAIDMIGTPGIHAVEGLAGSDGQRTISHQLGAKTIPCSFAVKDVGNVEWLKNRLTEVFFPKLSGTMTVETMYSHYEIECYPLNVPTFKMAENDGVWRFDVDFSADYPYWRVGAERVVTIGSGDVDSGRLLKTFKSDCPYDIHPTIIFPANSRGIVMNIASPNESRAGFNIEPHDDFAIRLVSGPKFSMINTSTGASCTNYISASVSVGELLIKYGDNIVTVYYDGTIPELTISYHDLSMGEI